MAPLKDVLQGLVAMFLALRMPWILVEVEGLKFQYHDQAEITSLTKYWSQKFPNLSYVYSIGKSVKGQDLWVIAIGQNPSQHSLLVPNVKYIGNMHGNEVVGREMLLHLAEHLLENYSRNETLARFLNMTQLHIMPTMNPDGFELSREGDCDSISGRANAHGIDLNRNFPDKFVNRTTPEQLETLLIKGWIQSTHFVLSANLHGGALVVNYPFDAYQDEKFARYIASPDDDVFKYLSLTYSRTHATMHNGTHCGDYFQDGITNGANWYPIFGGMADYMYVNGSGYQILIEMSCCKYPGEDKLEGFWESNRDALINFMFAVHMGIKGLILGQSSVNGTLFEPLEGAKYLVKGRESVVFISTKYGEYYKLLLPGEYVLQVSHPGFNPAEVPFSVQDSVVTRKDIKLFRDNFVFHKTVSLMETAEAGSSQLKRCLVVIISFSIAAVITPLFFL